MPNDDGSANGRGSWLRAVWGGVQSLLIPGLGQVYARAWKLGFSWIVIQIAVLVAYRLLTNIIPPKPVLVGFVTFCLACWTLFHIGAALEAARRIRLRPSRVRPAWYKSAWFTGIGSSVVTVAVVFGIHLGWKPFSINQNGGLPSMPAGTIVVFDARGFPRMPDRGDTVVFDAGQGRGVFVKRVIGLPGDVIRYVRGQLVLNHEVVPRLPDGSVTFSEGGVVLEAMRYAETLPGGRTYPIAQMSDAGMSNNTGEMTVPQGNVFVLGDNRDRSLDSRFKDLGPVPIGNLIGAASVIAYSRDLSRVLSIAQ